MCINRENKPATCLCGCSLMCGIYTYFVLTCLMVISAFTTLNIVAILEALLCLAPLIALLIKPESWGIRLWNYVWQWIQMGLLLIVAVLVIISFAFAGAMSGGAAIVALGPVVLIALGIIIPVQSLWLCIFKAHFEALSEHEKVAD